MKTIMVSLLMIMTGFNSSLASDSTSASRQPSQAIDVLLFDGYSVYYRMPLGERSFLRLGLNASVNSSDEEDNGTTHDEYPGTSQERADERHISSSNNSYSLSLSIHSVVAEIPHASFYLSIGPLLTYSTGSSSNETEYIQGPTTDKYISNSSEERWGAGGILFFGVCSPLSSIVCVVAEYQLSAVYTWGDRTSEYESHYSSYFSKNKRVGETSGTQYNLSSLKLGITVQL